MKEKKFYNIEPWVKVAMLMKAPDTDWPVKRGYQRHWNAAFRIHFPAKKNVLRQVLDAEVIFTEKKNHPQSHRKKTVGQECHLAASQHSLGAYLEHPARTMNERISVAARMSALWSEVTHKKQFILWPWKRLKLTQIFCQWKKCFCFALERKHFV
jgi:hypothetical protein